VGRHRRRLAQLSHSVPFGEDHVAVFDNGHGDAGDLELLAGALHNLIDVVLCRANGGGNEKAEQRSFSRGRQKP
jgi:hypothetical protein